MTARKFIIVLPRTKGSAMAQAVSCRPLAAEARDRSQATPCEDCGGQSGTETGFPPRTSVVPYEYYPTNAPHWSSSGSCSYRKGKRAKPTNFPKKQCSLRNRRDGHQSSFVSLFQSSTDKDRAFYFRRIRCRPVLLKMRYEIILV